ncbi:MAG: enoyl-CoA hydratase/isomerase family protein [Thermoleophilia bacterium]
MTTYRELACRRVGNYVVVLIEHPSDAAGWMGRIANELEDLSDDINWDDETRVVVLSYPGDVFELGGEQDASGGAADPSSIVASVARIRQPVIAAVDGETLGLGLELALACDLRLGTEGARFGLPQIRNGAMPAAGGTQRLPRLVGPGRALEMVLTGESVDAQEAARIGLVHGVVPAATLMDHATALAEEMAARSPLSMNTVKEALHDGLDMTLDQGMRMELDLYLLLFSTQDRVEGINAFKERRTPKFEGR